MADYYDHIRQAEHNEALGEILATQLQRYRDWLITVSFYAAIHYVEADFAEDPVIKHSETSKWEGETPHDCRQRLVKRKYGRDCWKSYRKLREASRDVRYLARAIPPRRKPGTALDYYTQQDAEYFFRHHLKVVREAAMG
jgi:hypothetical protein